jgi:hypothetical protein
MEDIKISIPADDNSNKSVQQVEKDVLDKHREENGESPISVDDDVIKIKIDDNVSAKSEVADDAPDVKVNEDGDILLSEQDVFKFLRERTGRDINTFDDLVEVKIEEKQVELDEDVAAYQEYKKRTGRSIMDYIELNKDYVSMSDEDVVQNFYEKTLEGFDQEDIEFKIDSEFGFDEYDDDKIKRQKKLELKKAAIEARKFFEKEKEQFNIPLESRSALVPESEKEDFEQFVQYKQKRSEQEQLTLEKQKFFSDKTRSLFTEKFEGFEFKSGDKSFKYKPGEPDSLMKTQSDINNFLKKHLDDRGFLKDTESYHKALSVAMDPQAFFDYAFELGKSLQIDESIKKSKNIDMSPRSISNTVNANGVRVTDTSASQKSGLRIRKRK